MDQTVFTIIIPIYNESDNLPRFTQELKSYLQNAKEKYQVLFVDDGSTDQSARLIPGKQIIQLKAHQGKTAAIRAGLANATGEAVIILDGDCQYACRDIALFVAAYQKGNAMVCGWRKKRRDTLSRTVPSFFTNILARFIFGTKIHDLGCGLKLYRKNLLRDHELPDERHRLLPLHILNQNPGLKYTEVIVRHFPRTKGRAKYGLERTVPVLQELIQLRQQWKKL